jgi:aminoglycoside 3-N-acetyltransferase I
MLEIETRRLQNGDRELARSLFTLMAEVFEEERASHNDAYLDGLLNRPDFWVIAALHGNEIVGGITAHTLPMTRDESSELFIYDLAVKNTFQRQGIGTKLVTSLCHYARAAGITETFVAADNEDTHALDFYRAIGGESAPVTIFSFNTDETNKYS